MFRMLMRLYIALLVRLSQLTRWVDRELSSVLLLDAQLSPA